MADNAKGHNTMFVRTSLIALAATLATSTVSGLKAQPETGSVATQIQSLSDQRGLIDFPSFENLQAQMFESPAVAALRNREVIVDLPSASDPQAEVGSGFVSAPIPSLRSHRLCVDLPSSWRVVWARYKSGHGSYTLDVNGRDPHGKSDATRRIEIAVFQRFGLFVGSYRGAKIGNVMGTEAFMERLENGSSSFTYNYISFPTRRPASAWIRANVSSHDGLATDQDNFAIYVFQHLHFAE